MDALPEELFQMMLQLSRIHNADRLLEVFVTSMNSIVKEVDFSIIYDEQNPGIETFEIATPNSHFGKIGLEYDQFVVPISKKNIIAQAIEMLAVLLENGKQQEKLKQEKEYIKKEWQKQTNCLHERDEQYRTLAENSEDMILRFDKQLTIVYANLCTENVYEIPRSFLIGKNIRDIDQPIDQMEFWTHNLERVFNAGISINERLKLYKQSRKYYYDIKFVPEKNAEGDVINVFATARDITGLIKQGRELYDSQYHLKQAQRIAKIGSWEWNLRYNQVILSDELYKILGYVPKETTLSIDVIKHYIKSDLIAGLEEMVESPPDSFEEFEIGVDIKRADDQIRHCMVRGEPVFGSNGKLKKLHGTLQDITDRILMEIEIKNARLKAEESDRLKSAFLANMSHEIRTPLNGILGFSELLRRKNLSGDKRLFYTDIICSNSKQLLKIISDIIDISKIESGQIFIEHEECDISTMLCELYAFFQTDLTAKSKGKIEIVKITPNGGLAKHKVVCDEIRLKQVLSNLLANACKFTHQGQIDFGYELKEGYIEFFVNDTGIGIKPEDQKLVFERFRQANDSVSREYGGTGLGLAICKSLVELMGGNIWVISEENVGSEFRFNLPLEISETEPVEPTAEQIGNGEYTWPGKRILIVEDDIPSIELLKESLSDSFVDVVFADDGEKAIRMHHDTKPDVILMDIRLPKMNGLDAIRTIRNVDKKVAIIAITANAFVEDRVNCLSAGSNEYISKPVDRDQLLSTIDKWMHRI
jgi:PAS domain S-box-containing protein